MADADWTGGLAPHHELMLAERPEDPELRESASIWLFDGSGAFGLPRVGIEAQGAVWEQHRFDANIAFATGRVLRESRRAEARPALDGEGRPTVLATGGLSFRCAEPFRRWQVRYEGEPFDTSVSDMIGDRVDETRRTPLRFEVELTMAAPAWVQDNTPEKLATLSEQERIDAGLMGYGFRKEQLCRAEGWLEVDGVRRPMRATGSHIHRRSVRPMAAFRGHCWQSAVFPDGRAFGYIAYPPVDGEPDTYNEGYVFQDGRWHAARARRVPFLRTLAPAGDDVSVELESALGVTRIEGTTALGTFRIGNPGTMGLTIHQGGALYRWGDQAAYGMIERSAHQELIRAVP